MVPSWSRERASGGLPGGLYFFVDSPSDGDRRPTEKVEPGGLPDALHL
jgi:hypothetical protein